MPKDNFKKIVRNMLYIPIHRLFFLFLLSILFVVLSLLYLNIVGVAFKSLFPILGSFGIYILLVSCLLGSSFNIPLKKIGIKRPIVRLKYVTVFGITYPIPSFENNVLETWIAINLGGAVIPIITSFYLLYKSAFIFFEALLATIIVSIIVKAVSKPVLGLGITIPALLSPIIAMFSAIILNRDYSYIIAYVSGTLGTLIGADLLNFNNFSKLGAPVISIGGAGIFDGIFLSGIIAVLLA